MNHAFEIIPLSIETSGKIISSNLDEFRELVREALGKINRDLKTDEDFGQAELDVKALKSAEEAVRSAALQAFDDELKKLVETLDETAEEIRAPRLELEKLIAEKKEKVKSDIIEEHLAKFDIDPSDARRNFLGGLQSAVKGKRTLDSIRKACHVYQLSTQAVIHKSRAHIESFEKAHGPDITMDRRELELRSPDLVEAELRRRFEAKKAAEDKKHLEQEAAKAKEEAQAAIKQAEEASKPPAPPAASAQVMPGNLVFADAGPALDKAVEWAAYEAECLAAFLGMKAAREMLKHPLNIARAQQLANSFGSVWANR